ncbi:hypothetical protein FSP39_016809 [Pinctada imbricata]|uniref:BPTI/Kunitz inhibitor domain-containing protein n=1 Tax=Pinctada imbricata TaxID=66713 RepID=A0AA88Y783_PINIB|nr:hypothetical protein FSP39_016809 [Pinctada imbricata]
MLPTVPGNCFAYIPGFSYDPMSGKCEQFIYSGCGGNHNRFRTRQDCIKSCACHMPPEVGPCSRRPAWFYNPEKGCCEKYAQGGCPGNGNAFGSYQECKNMCAGTTSGVVLPLGSNWGSQQTVQFDLERRSSPAEYFMSYRVPKAVWLHNERVDLNRMNPNVRNFMRVVTSSGKTQVPGIQTQSTWRSMPVPVGGAISRQITSSGGMQPVGGFVRSGSVSSSSGMMPSGGAMGVFSGMQTSGGTAGGMMPVGGSMSGFSVGGEGMSDIHNPGSDVHMPGTPYDIMDAHSGARHPNAASGTGMGGSFGSSPMGGGMGMVSGGSSMGTSSGMGGSFRGAPGGGGGSQGMGMVSGASSMGASSGMGGSLRGIPAGGGRGNGMAILPAAGGSIGAGGGGGGAVSDIHFPGSSNDIIDAHSGAMHPNAGASSRIGSNRRIGIGSGMGGGGSMVRGGGGGGGGGGMRMMGGSNSMMRPGGGSMGGGRMVPRSSIVSGGGPSGGIMSRGSMSGGGLRA